MNDTKVGGSFREKLKHIRLNSNQFFEFLDWQTVDATFETAPELSKINIEILWKQIQFICDEVSNQAVSVFMKLKNLNSSKLKFIFKNLNLLLIFFQLLKHDEIIVFLQL